jgi:glycosyltransferase involved in cell wall biosynthesis
MTSAGGQELLSIVLPVRNGADYLTAALDSVLAQTLGQFTLHVSDNASEDGTAHILSDYAARDPRIRVSRSETPLSQVANMNRAVALAEAPWVRMLCHDDLLRPDCMAQTLAAVEAVDASRVALIGNGERHLFANGHLTPAAKDAPLEHYSGVEVLRRRFTGAADSVDIPSVTTATLRKAAFDARGGFDPRWVHFDIFAWYELLTEWDYAFLPAQLTVNRIHGAQVAIAARASLRSAEDHRAFVGPFIARHGDAIGLNACDRLRASLIAPGYAARALVAEMRASRSRNVFAQFPHIPAAWLPLMPPLMWRAWRNEARRFAALDGQVPLELFYPR